MTFPGKCRHKIVYGLRAVSDHSLVTNKTLQREQSSSSSHYHYKLVYKALVMYCKTSNTSQVLNKSQCLVATNLPNRCCYWRYVL